MRQSSESQIGNCPSGVYLIDALQRDRIVRGNVFQANVHLGILDGDVAGSREAFFTEIARTMQFPDYFGRNWDAVYDCLTDPSWFPTGGVVIVLDRFGRMASAEPEQWQTALKVMQDACAFWRPLHRLMYVLLYETNDEVLDITKLPADCLNAI